MLKSPELKKSLETDEFARFIDLSVIRFSGSERRKLRLSANFYQKASQEERAKVKHENFNVDIEISVSRFYVVRKLIWFSLKYDQFGDYLFPFIPIIAIVFFFFLKGSWQGSFEQLAFK